MRVLSTPILSSRNIIKKESTGEITNHKGDWQAKVDLHIWWQQNYLYNKEESPKKTVWQINNTLQESGVDWLVTIVVNSTARL